MTDSPVQAHRRRAGPQSAHDWGPMGVEGLGLHYPACTACVCKIPKEDLCGSERRHAAEERRWDASIRRLHTERLLFVSVCLLFVQCVCVFTAFVYFLYCVCALTLTWILGSLSSSVIFVSVAVMSPLTSSETGSTVFSRMFVYQASLTRTVLHHVTCTTHN